MERFYEELGLRDAFYERYGWTSREFDDTPQREIDHLPAVWKAKNDVAERKKNAEQAKQKASGKG